MAAYQVVYDLELHAEDYGWVAVGSDVCVAAVPIVTHALDRAGVHFRWRRRMLGVTPPPPRPARAPQKPS